MARLVGDFGAVLLGAANGALTHGTITCDARVAVCVVVAAAGYPSTVMLGDTIGNVPRSTDDVLVFHAGTARQCDKLVTSGGRVLGITALGVSVAQARDRAYTVVDAIDLPGKQVRRDIGARR
jgi:phosphoribosylamine--glycine ligase